MPKLRINFDFKNLAGKFAKNLNLLFFAVFLILLVFEILQINTSLQMILKFRREPQTLASKEKGVRINFEDYYQVVDRVERAKTFQPTRIIVKNPFRSAGQ